MDISEKLEEIFGKIKNHLDELDKVRESILQVQRKTVRLCSEIIKRVHREQWESIEELIKTAKHELKEMEALTENAPGDLPKDYLQIVKQELGEATILYHLLKHDSLPKAKEIGINVVDYAYALADVVGELRRSILKSIRLEEMQRAKQLLTYMEDIYNYLFTLDYPSGLIPGLRKKTDNARRILANTEGEVTVSINMIELKKELQKHKKCE